MSKTKTKFDEAIDGDERQQRMDYVAAWALASLITKWGAEGGIGEEGATMRQEDCALAWDYAEAWEAERQRRLGK